MKKRKKKTSKEIWYVAKHPTGTIWFRYCGDTQKQVRNDVILSYTLGLANLPDAERQIWRKLYRQGWRVVRAKEI